MKHSLIITGLCALLPISLTAEEPAPADTLAKHKEGSVKVAEDQDELSADVQQLVIEQTVPKVIELFNEAEKIMDEATDRLDEADTGGETLAAQTEIIEKIYEAAKEKQGQGGQSKSGGAMMDMLERMKDGEKPGDKEGKSKGKGDKPGDEGGKGQAGLSDSANDASTGDAGGKNEARRVPKAGGNATLELPEEFRKAFDAYNRGAEKKVK
jgi:hypothetical protein